MKKTSYIIVAITALTLCLPAAAQQRKSGSRPSQTEWMKGVREYKHDMLIKEVELTKAQQEEFLPLYAQMEEEIYQANKDVRDLESKVSNSKDPVSDLEYGKAAEALSEVSMVKAQIEENYYKKFAKILSKKQMFQLKRAEIRFSKSMISHKSQGSNKKK